MRGPAWAATIWLLAATLGPVAACGDDEPEAPVVPTFPSAAIDWSERLAEPTVPDLLAALHQSHATVRPALGPHTLHTVTDFSLAPPTAGEPELHRVDQPVVLPQRVHDELSLRWASADEDDPRIGLSQSNDHDRGRDVIVVGQTVHVRHAHRSWNHYTRDSDVVEHWLDDAQRSVHDVLELAAPRLSLAAQVVDGGGLDGGAAVEITLDLADDRADERVAAGPTQAWRRQAELESIAGTVRLDARSGAWLSANVDVTYALTGADGRPLAGRVHLEGTVEIGAPAPVQAPADSQPLPERVRLDDEQHRLLDGLAAP